MDVLIASMVAIVASILVAAFMNSDKQVHINGNKARNTEETIYLN